MIEAYYWHKRDVYGFIDTIICCSGFMKQKIDMKKNLLTLKTQFETYKVSLELDTYLDSKRIAILLIGWEKKRVLSRCNINC